MYSTVIGGNKYAKKSYCDKVNEQVTISKIDSLNIHNMLLSDLSFVEIHIPLH